MQAIFPHMGQRIRELAHEKNISAKEIADKTGMTRAGVYDTFKRKHLTDKTVEKFCEVIGIDVNQALYLSNDELSNQAESTKPVDFQAKYLKELEQRVAEQSKQISEQSKQLAQQAQTIMSLVEKLGKFEASELLAEYDA